MATLKMIFESARANKSACPMVPRNAIKQKTVLSKVCPTSVEPMVLIQSHFVPVIFLMAKSVHALEKVPAR